VAVVALPCASRVSRLGFVAVLIVAVWTGATVERAVPTVECAVRGWVRV
jgi:hypothetical protein